jgi:DNA mismatch repair protein MSH3
MVEMTEASDILKTATDKSLVILDELGRGTSTFDGVSRSASISCPLAHHSQMAIADAVLQHLIDEVKCKTLFITHYPLVATEVEKKFPNDVQNLHMGFTEIQQINGTREITFLYQLTSGVASGSFGVECGRLAALPESLLENAARQAASMQSAVEERHRRFRYATALLL